MREDRKAPNVPAEEIIAAFDRELAEADELKRRHLEHVRSSRTYDRPINQEASRARNSR